MFPTHMALQNNFSRTLGADSVEPKAQRLFDRALSTGRNRRMVSRLTGRTRQLDLLAQSRTGTQQPLGRRTIALSEITGSLNKPDDFDVDFMPTHERVENRWLHVASAMLRGVTLPPVELVLYKGTYYVSDGHHRISVAKMMKQGYIDAIVVEWSAA